jgi:microcephalin
MNKRVTNYTYKKYDFQSFFQVIEQLGGFKLNEKVDDQTTHLVVGKRGRTLNVIRALIRGVWLLDFEWIVASEKSGTWRLEDVFQIRDWMGKVYPWTRQLRSGCATFKLNLLYDQGPFYVSANNTIPKSELEEIILSLNGKVLQNKNKAKVIIARGYVHAPENAFPGHKVVHPSWIFDSVENLKVMDINNYVMQEPIV